MANFWPQKRSSQIIMLVVWVIIGWVVVSSYWDSTKPPESSETPGPVASSVTAPAPQPKIDQPPHAQDIGDPYAAGQRNLQAQSYESEKQDALAKISEAQWAANCRVISAQQSFLIGQMLMANILPGGVNTTDPHLGDDMARAHQQGDEKFKSAGCSYWQQNPEAVSAMRGEAQLAYIH